MRKQDVEPRDWAMNDIGSFIHSALVGVVVVLGVVCLVLGIMAAQCGNWLVFIC